MTTATTYVHHGLRANAAEHAILDAYLLEYAALRAQEAGVRATIAPELRRLGTLMDDVERRMRADIAALHALPAVQRSGEAA